MALQLFCIFLICQLMTGNSGISGVVADSTYKSRPDLAPPKLNITIPASASVERGFLYIAPFTGFPNSVDHGPLQSAPYILTYRRSGMVRIYTSQSGQPTSRSRNGKGGRFYLHLKANIIASMAMDMDTIPS
jgi:hypothetical protein